MKKLFFVSFSAVIMVVFLSYLAFAQDKTPAPKKHGFVGVEVCAPCHKSEKAGKQFDIWKNSKHSQAYQTLLTENANKIAKDLGFTTPASQTEKCLKCHVSGYGVEAELIGKKFKMEDGVQCETCHGPGSDYKDMKVMKDRDAAITNGLTLYADLDAYCVKCHNSESPTFVKADTKEMWEKIKHPTPKTK